MKKGYSLLEIIISIGLCTLIATSMISLLLRYRSSYSLDVKRSQNHFYMEEALLFIENSVKQCKYVSVSNNHIELDYENINIKKYIGLNTDRNLVITHAEYGVNSTSNNILNHISDFNVIQKGNTIYISITALSGERYERCVGIKLIN